MDIKTVGLACDHAGFPLKSLSSNIWKTMAISIKIMAHIVT